VEYDKTTSQKPTVIKGTTNATEITFSGHGTAKDINFTDNGNALIIPHGGSAVLLQGKDNLVSSGGDKASLNFMELGHVDANGMVKVSGAAFYDANATGKLAYLSNTVSIHTDEVDKHGDGKVLAWEWNKRRIAYGRFYLNTKEVSPVVVCVLSLGSIPLPVRTLLSL
jgi:sorbitol-specific phosphotransferase system component IIA